MIEQGITGVAVVKPKGSYFINNSIFYMSEFTLRPGRKEDVPTVYALIKELADFERCPNEVETTEQEILHYSFGDEPIIGFLVAEAEGQIVGLSLYYVAYSTWKGKCLYLEDLIVTETYRGKGIGKALLEATAKKANELGAKRLMWQVLEWNANAIEFYKSLGAEVTTEWYNCRLYGEELKKFG